MGAVAENIVLVLTPSNRPVERCAEKLQTFRAQDDGYAYLEYAPMTPKDQLFPEDLAVTSSLGASESPSRLLGSGHRGRSPEIRAVPWDADQWQSRARRMNGA